MYYSTSGTQYASFIYTFDDIQKSIATDVLKELQAAMNSNLIENKVYAAKTVSTAISPNTVFYEAKKEHQEYLERNPNGYVTLTYNYAPKIFVCLFYYILFSFFLRVICFCIFKHIILFT